LNKIFIFIITTIFFCLIFLIFSLYLPFINSNHGDKPFECGINSNFSAGFPLSFQFFVIGVLFLIFDVEISLILPFPLEVWSLYNSNLMFFVFFILILGVLYEWKGGKINWSQWMRLLICKKFLIHQNVKKISNLQFNWCYILRVLI